MVVEIIVVIVIQDVGSDGDQDNGSDGDRDNDSDGDRDNGSDRDILRQDDSEKYIDYGVGGADY